MHRFFIEENLRNDDLFTIQGQDLKHIRDVLRLKLGDELELVSELSVYICELSLVTKTIAEARIIEKLEKVNEPHVRLSLFQGMPKASKMEIILQKCTEIGISEFHPVTTERSVIKIRDIDKESRKLDRWRSIVEESAKQSRRDIVPSLGRILSFEDMMTMLKDKIVLVPYELEKKNTLEVFFKKISEPKEICIVIGPEGGFGISEIEALKNIGAHTVTLGRRILRTETAGVAVSSIILYELGDLGVIE